MGAELRRAAGVTGRVMVLALLLARHALRRLLPGGSRPDGPGRGLRARLTSGLPELLADLGPTFLKGGQILATRPDLLPPDVESELAVLHTHVRPPPAPALRRAILRAYGDPRAWPFRAFEWEPYRSGSVATVHRATLPSGQRVAVKVLRPGVAATFAKDHRVVRAAARAAGQLRPLRDVPLVRVVDELATAVGRQTDLAHEAAMLSAFRANLANLPYVRVPAPLREHSAEGVLVMEFVDGLTPIGTPGTVEPRRTVQRCLTIVYQMLFRNGLVHCDLHPGNFATTPAGEVVLLDTGFSYRLTPHMRRSFAAFFFGMSLGDGNRCADVVIETAVHVSPAFDEAGFRADMRELIAGSVNLRAGEFRLPHFAATLFDVQRRHGVASAPEFVFPILSLLVVEGMIKRLDVDVPFQQLAIPPLTAALARAW